MLRDLFATSSVIALFGIASARAEAPPLHLEAGALGGPKNSCPGNPRNDAPFAMKGTWIAQTATTGLLDTTRGVSKVMERSRELGLNAIFPVAWTRGEIFHKKGKTREEFGLTTRQLFTADEKGNMAPREDILEETIKQAHAGDKPLKVMPWFEYGLHVPPSTDLAKKHPEWFLRKRSETPIDMTKLDASAQDGRLGAPTLILNPVVPEARAFLVGLIKDVVENYDVDGIQLDDHFQWPIEFGYDPTTQAAYNLDRYRKSHGGKDPPAEDRKQVEGTPLPIATNPEWMRWRADQLSGLMREIAQTVRATKPKIEIQLSPPPAKWAYDKYLQDWPSWADPKNGYVDRIIVQNYVEKNFDAEIGKLEKMNLCVPVDIGVLAGRNSADPPKEVMNRLKKTQDSKAKLGFSLFPYDFMPSSLEGLDEL